jgi:hypothetical protein
MQCLPLYQNNLSCQCSMQAFFLIMKAFLRALFESHGHRDRRRKGSLEAEQVINEPQKKLTETKVT